MRLSAFAAFAKRAFSLATAVFVELGVIVVLWLLVLGGSERQYFHSFSNTEPLHLFATGGSAGLSGL